MLEEETVRKEVRANGEGERRKKGSGIERGGGRMEGEEVWEERGGNWESRGRVGERGEGEKDGEGWREGRSEEERRVEGRREGESEGWGEGGREGGREEGREEGGRGGAWREFRAKRRS
jgi:hypothetical protein